MDNIICAHRNFLFSSFTLNRTLDRLQLMFYLFGFVFATLILWPHEASAWGPVAHLHFAQTVISQAEVLPLFVRNIITQFPQDFYYGCIAADITLGKKFVEYIHNCHNWDVGLKILRQAKDKATEAFAYGYLCHLGVDTVSHNYFVPYQLIASFRTRVLRHIYWEMRYDTMLNKPALAAFAKTLAKKGKYQHHDKYLDGILKRTLFSFRMNRRIFSGLILLHDLESWQKTTRELVQKSKWELPHKDITELKKLAVSFALDFLSKFEESRSYTKDPSGYNTLAWAKKKRKEFKKAYRRGELETEEIPKQLQKIRTSLKKKLLS